MARIQFQLCKLQNDAPKINCIKKKYICEKMQKPPRVKLGYGWDVQVLFKNYLSKDKRLNLTTILLEDSWLRLLVKIIQLASTFGWIILMFRTLSLLRPWLSNWIKIARIGDEYYSYRLVTKAISIVSPSIQYIYIHLQLLMICNSNLY